MDADRTRELLFPITILVSVAVGAVIGTVLGRTGSEDRSPTVALGQDPTVVVEALHAVLAELVRVRERLESRSIAAASSEKSDTRSPAVPDATAEMRKVTADLLQAADSLRSASIHARAGSPPLIPPTEVDPLVWKELGQRSFAENKKTYILWNYQQVLDRFGAPDDIFGHDSKIEWVYRHDGKRTTTFRFTDGLVVAVQTPE